MTHALPSGRPAADRHCRVGILGAGPAGLSAAAYLSDAGYRDVVVLEKTGSAGGKCRTVRAHGYDWELGAMLGTIDYEATLGLMARVGLAPYPAIERARTDGEIDTSGISRGLWPMDLSHGWLGADMAKAISGMAHYRAIAGQIDYCGGHLGMPSGLGDSFADWSRREGLSALARMLAIPFTAYGYGYYEDIPAAYVLKYFEPGFLTSLVLRKDFFTWNGGAQSLWERLALRSDVRYGAEVTAIARPKVLVGSAGGGGERLPCDSPMEPRSISTSSSSPAPSRRPGPSWIPTPKNARWPLRSATTTITCSSAGSMGSRSTQVSRRAASPGPAQAIP
jgi:hypothetical protein